MPPAPGGALGPFQLVERLGEGAHASVFRAVHAASGRPVAIKVLKEQNPSAMRALEREVQAVASLSHPSIVEVYDTGLVPGDAAAGLVEGTRWVALELATHGCLADKPPTQYVSLQHSLLQILSALAHAHARGVIHRDLKPANVLRSGRRLKLADFGLAWAVEHRKGPKIAGTPGYMAPEQIRGEAARIGPWTDLYALGCLAWELTTGAPPFQGGLDDVFAQHQTDEAPRFEPVMDVPRDFEIWVRRLLGKEPEVRGDSAAVAAARLLAMSSDIRTSVSRPAPSLANALTWTASVADTLGSMSDEAPDYVPSDDPWLMPRPDWRMAERSRPAVWLLGASLGLYTLRAAPVLGRFSERDHLWATVCTAATRSRPIALSVHGDPGMGCSALGRWLTLAVREGGLGSVLAIPAGQPAPIQSHAPRLNAQLNRGLVVVWLDDPTPSTAMAWVDWAHDPDNASKALLVLVTGGEHVRGATPLVLPPSPDHDIAELCRHVAGLSPAASSAIAARAGGNPGDALGLVRALVEQGRLQAGPIGFGVPQGLEHLPQTQAQRVSQQVATLIASTGHDLRPVAIAALLNAQVPHAAWISLCAHCGVEADPGPFTPLLEANLAVWSGRWRFSGATIIEGVLAQLPAAEVRRLAYAMAQGLAVDAQWSVVTELRAALLLRAGHPDEALTAAAATHHAFIDERTLSIARAALAQITCADDDPRVVWLDMNTLSTAWLTHNGHEALRRAIARMEGLSGEARLVALPVASTIARAAGEQELALALLDEAVAQRSSPHLLHLRSIVLEELDRLDEAEACARRGLAWVLTRPNSRDLAALTNDVADWERVHGRMDAAEEGFRTVLRLPEHLLARALEGIVRENLVLLYAARGDDWPRAFKETQRIVAIALEEGSGSLGRSTYLTTLALTAAHIGRLDVVEDCVVRIEAEPNWRLFQLGVEGLTQLVRAAEATQDDALARRILDVVRRTGPESFDRAVAKARHGFFGVSPSDA